MFALHLTRALFPDQFGKGEWEYLLVRTVQPPPSEMLPPEELSRAASSQTSLPPRGCLLIASQRSARLERRSLI